MLNHVTLFNGTDESRSFPDSAYNIHFTTDLSFAAFLRDKLLHRIFAIKPTLVGNKRQTIKARVHANVYLRQNNNNSRANPPFGGLPCAEGEKHEVETGVRDVGGKTSKRERERKGEGESSPSTRAHLRTYARVCGFFRVSLAYSAFYRRRRWTGGKKERREGLRADG